MLPKRLKYLLCRVSLLSVESTDFRGNFGSLETAPIRGTVKKGRLFLENVELNFVFERILQTFSGRVQMTVFVYFVFTNTAAVTDSCNRFIRIALYLHAVLCKVSDTFYAFQRNLIRFRFVRKCTRFLILISDARIVFYFLKLTRNNYFAIRSTSVT